MSQDTRAAAVLLLGAEPTDEAGQRSTVVALLAIVVLLDQATKWWAWRHVSGALINSGGDLLVGRVVGSWYADTVTGGLLDLLGVGFLSIAVLVLVRRRRSLAVVASAALMIGGWGSNLLDRLGMHSWTAPGSTRGAVDFLPFSHYRFNLADIVIVGATALFVLSVGVLRLTAIRRSALAGNPAPPARRRLRAWMSALAGAVRLVVVVGVGTVGDSAMAAASREPARRRSGTRTSQRHPATQPGGGATSESRLPDNRKGPDPASSRPGRPLAPMFPAAGDGKLCMSR